MVTNNGTITTLGGGTGLYMIHNGSSGNITANANANITANTPGGAGIFAQFTGPSTGTANITIANGVAVSGGLGLAIDGGTNGNHQVTVNSGASIASTGAAAGIRLNGTN